jgi:hypothetical protein
MSKLNMEMMSDAVSVPERILFFGCSDVKLFSLLPCTVRDMHVFPKKCASDLTSIDTPLAFEITKALEASIVAVDTIVFHFGGKDVNFRYYYETYSNECKKKRLLDGNNTIESLNDVWRKSVCDVTERYVATIVELCSRKYRHCRLVVVGAYPTPIHDDSLNKSLVAYGVVGPEVIVNICDNHLDVRMSRIKMWNTCLKDSCNKHTILYDDVFEKLLAANGDSSAPRLILDDEYRDVSDFNIHIVWEKVLPVWISKWEWLSTRLSYDFATSLDFTYKKYYDKKSIEKKNVASHEIVSKKLQPWQYMAMKQKRRQIKSPYSKNRKERRRALQINTTRHKLDDSVTISEKRSCRIK